MHFGIENENWIVGILSMQSLTLIWLEFQFLLLTVNYVIPVYNLSRLFPLFSILYHIKIIQRHLMKYDNQKALESQSICISEFFYCRHMCQLRVIMILGETQEQRYFALWAWQVPQSKYTIILWGKLSFINKKWNSHWNWADIALGLVEQLLTKF